MPFQLKFSFEAAEILSQLEQTDPKKHRKVLKTLGLMEANLRHPSLKTHKYDSTAELRMPKISTAARNTPVWDGQSPNYQKRQRASEAPLSWVDV